MRIFTAGHGARTLEDFLETLASGPAEQVIDVRRFPGSRRSPHFSSDLLAESLATHGLGYAWLADLGGRRKLDKKTSRNTAWRVDAFRAYADYMDTPEFLSALEQLLELAALRPSAIMCAETHPSQCHRRLISDKLASLGHEVVHLISPKRSEPHQPPPFLRVDGDRLLYVENT